MVTYWPMGRIGWIREWFVFLMGLSSMVWDFITLLRKAINLKLINFWNFSFIIFGLQLTAGKWNCGKQNCVSFLLDRCVRIGFLRQIWLLNSFVLPRVPCCFFLDIANLEVSHCLLLALTKTMKLIFSIQFPLLQIIMTNLFSGSVHTGGGCLLPLHVNDNLAWYRIHWLPCIYF